MKLQLLTLLGLGIVTVAPLAQAARIGVDLGDVEIRNGHRIVIDRDRDRDHDLDRFEHRHNRLVSETQRRIIEPDGDRVIITRRVYEEPDGDRVVRETRRVIDR